MTKVFGIGWAKTGTTTLGECFRTLGYAHQPQDLGLVKHLAAGELDIILKKAEHKETFEDWPWLLLFKELDIAYPGSKFVLTMRHSDKWIASYENMLTNQGEASSEMNFIRQTLYGLPFPSVTREQLIRRYERHNQEVMDYFANRREDLLIVDWSTGDGWPELCKFLKLPVPNTALPHANRGAYNAKGGQKVSWFRRWL